MLEPGRAADFIAVAGSPLKNVALLQDKKRIRHVHLAGKRIELPDRPYDPREVTDLAWTNWNDLYTQSRVAELGILPERKTCAVSP